MNTYRIAQLIGILYSIVMDMERSDQPVRFVAIQTAMLRHCSSLEFTKVVEELAYLSHIVVQSSCGSQN
jgi:hypothetical protein